MLLKWWGKSHAPQALQASKNHEQKFEEDQHDGVHGLPQRWDSLSTREGWEYQVQEKKEKKPKEEALVILGEWTSGGEESSSSD